MSDWYILDDNGNPVRAPDLHAWAKWMATTRNDRHVANDTIGDVHVSTVFLGVDHGWGRGAERPVLWESMIFGGRHDQYQERYTSREDALAGHQRALNLVMETCT